MCSSDVVFSLPLVSIASPGSEVNPVSPEGPPPSSRFQQYIHTLLKGQGPCIYCSPVLYNIFDRVVCRALL